MAAKKKRASRTEVRSGTGGGQSKKGTSTRGKAKIVTAARSGIRKDELKRATSPKMGKPLKGTAKRRAR